MAEPSPSLGVSWFEEPVSSDDLDGLRLIRDRAPAGMDVAAGEYGYTPDYFARMLAAGAVDCFRPTPLAAWGITGWMQANALCEARSMPLSAHCAPSIHAHPAAPRLRLRHIEYFHDHARIERMLFDGVLEPSEGCLWPDASRPGLGPGTAARGRGALAGLALRCAWSLSVFTGGRSHPPKPDNATPATAPTATIALRWVTTVPVPCSCRTRSR